MPRLNFKGYEPLDIATKPQKVAHLLAWCAEKHPKTFVSYEDITQMVYNLSRRPRVDSKEVDSIKSAAFQAKEILHKEYHLGAQSRRGVGIRACINRVDAVRNDYTARAIGLAKKAQRLEDRIRGIKLTEIDDPVARKNLQAMKKFIKQTRGTMIDSTAHYQLQMPEDDE